MVGFVSFGLIIAPVFVMNPAVQGWQNAMEFPVYVLCGFLFPIALLPGWTTPDLLPAAAVLGGRGPARHLHRGRQPAKTALAWGMLVVFSAIDLFLHPGSFKPDAVQGTRRCNAWDGVAPRLAPLCWTEMTMKTVLNGFRLFWQGAILAYVALFHWLRPIQYLASKIVMPLAQMFFFVYLGTYATGASNASFYIVGNALQIAAVSGIYGVTMSIGGERNEGTLPYLFGTPANRMLIFLGRAFMNIIDGAIGVVIAFVWGVVLMGLDLSHTNIAALALTILITTISTCGLGLLLGSLALVTVNVMFINNLVYFLLLIFSGANVATAIHARLDPGHFQRPAADAWHCGGASAGRWGEPGGSCTAAAGGARHRHCLRPGGIRHVHGLRNRGQAPGYPGARLATVLRRTDVPSGIGRAMRTV